MFEKFGAKQVEKGGKLFPQVEFNIFFPKWGTGETQYAYGGEPNINKIKVFGTFQKNPWDETSAIELSESEKFGGTIWNVTIDVSKPGFYEYRYIVHFKNGEKRIIGDPCTKYSVHGPFEICGFVVDNPNTYKVEDHTTEKLKQRLPLKDLNIYELFIWDFTSEIRDNKAPIDAVIEKLESTYFDELGINAIEFMPWTGWLGGGFSWGYNNYLFFSVEEAYVNIEDDRNTNRLDKLIELINKCHKRGIHVIMDCVLNHTFAESRGKGFPYYSFYQKPDDCPFLDSYMEGGYFYDFDYSNECTNLFILDVCKYWIENFGIDGIRFDYTKGFYNPANNNRGLTRIISDLKMYLASNGQANFSLILEHIDHYKAIDVCNKTKADGCWFEPFRSLSFDYLGKRPNGYPQIETSIMRMLNSDLDFEPDRWPILYIENHDHKRFALKAGGRSYWYMTQPYIIALFTCSGAPLIYNGQEFGQDNDMPEPGEPGERVVPRPILWNLRNDNIGNSLFTFYKKLIKLRKDHAGLRSPNFHPSRWDEKNELPDADGFGINKQQNTVVYHRWGLAEDGKLEKFYVVLNFSDGKSRETKSVSFNVPDDGPWEDLLSGVKKYASSVEGKKRLFIDVPANFGAIYYQKY